MEQLTAPESLYLELDAVRTPMHESSLALYDRSTAPGSVGLEELQRYFAERSHRAAFFRRRLARLPLPIARPYWVDDPGFDIEFHVRQIALPKPGDWRQLCVQVARLHARALDANRPLWECYVIEELDGIPGLAPGSFALFMKTHCSASGGALTAQAFSALHELSPDGRASLPKVMRYFDRSPTLGDLVLRSAIDAVRRPFALARHVLSKAVPLAQLGGRAVASLAPRTHSDGSATARENLLPRPRTRFNASVTPHRVVAGVRFAAASIERIRRRMPGADRDDIATAVIGGALRCYLEECLEPPMGSLFAEVPIAHVTGAKVRVGDAFAHAVVMPIHSDIDDPALRLQRIAEATRRLRTRAPRVAGRRWLLDAIELVPMAALGMAGALMRRVRLGSRLTPVANTSIARVQGPDVPLYLGGARLTAHYGLAAIHDLAGIAHVVGHCEGAMTIGVSACREMLPDPGRYEDLLRSEFDALDGALAAQHAKAPPRSAPGPRRGRRTSRVPAAAGA